MAGPGIPAEERGCGPRVSKSLITHLDLYPTILALAGAERKLERQRTGRDILPLLHNEPDSLHDAVYAELATSAMIRTAGWKMVFDPEQGGIVYLFNLSVDSLEEQNLAGVPAYDGIAKGLLERLLSHRIRFTQYTQAKEEQRYQHVRAG
jgi:arylsulfatase A-like enzyme